MSESIDRLWTPLITHYREDGSGGVLIDRERMAAHVDEVRPFVKQFLLAGSTGDGWDMNDEQLADIASFAATDVFAGTTVVVGALGRTTEDVVRRARVIEDSALAKQSAGAVFAGLTICPPVDAQADQARIIAHYEQVLSQTSAPVQMYELPQVTGCSMNAQTVRTVAKTGRVTMFKDTSGKDAVASDGVDGVRLVRGAEGDYFEALQEKGYDGLLLSSGNIFGPTLRRIVELHAAGSAEHGRDLARVLEAAIAALFNAATAIEFSNPFSNVSRGVDHLLAYGGGWREAPMPLAHSGDRLPEAVLAQFAERLLGLVDKRAGYLS